jgi:hypothetical protein
LTRKQISTLAPAISCDVCGRTLLRGENPDVFLHQGARRMVCELCTARAAHEGWIREGLDDATVRDGRSGRRGGRGLLGRLRARREPAGTEPPRDVRDEPAAAPEPVAETYAPETRTVHAVPTNADLKMQRALELFNASRHPRTVGGVSRSLGAPIIAVRPSATEGSLVSIVVAWELSWYRYEVDLADEGAGVRVAGQGHELSELPPADQVPNAAAGEDGGLHLVPQHA